MNNPTNSQSQFSKIVYMIIASLFGMYFIGYACGQAYYYFKH